MLYLIFIQGKCISIMYFSFSPSLSILTNWNNKSIILKNTQSNYESSKPNNTQWDKGYKNKNTENREQ